MHWQVDAIMKLGHNIYTYAYMRNLYDRDMNLFYALLLSNPAKMMPVCYTPTVGEVQDGSHQHSFLITNTLACRPARSLGRCRSSLVAAMFPSPTGATSQRSKRGYN